MIATATVSSLLSMLSMFTVCSFITNEIGNTAITFGKGEAPFQPTETNKPRFRLINSPTEAIRLIVTKCV